MTSDAEVSERRPGPITALRTAVGGTLAAVDEVVDYRALVPLRMAAGVLVLVHLAPFLGDAATGTTYADGFTVPYGAWYPEVPTPVYVAALALAAVSALLMALGLFTGVTTAYTALFVVYNLFLSRTHYHHNRMFIGVLLVGLALVPAGKAVSLDALRLKRRGRRNVPEGPRWPLMVLRFQVAAVYTASGVSKLLDPDWFGGIVTRLRVERAASTTAASGVPAWIVDLAATSEFHAVFAKIVVLTEIFIGIGLLVPRVRTAAIWVAILFHLAIAVTAQVEVFSAAALAALTIWVTPRSRDRTVVIGGGGSRWKAGLVGALDWTGRFRVIDEAHDDGVTVHDRQGVVLRGRRAVLGIAALLPVTFLVAAPLRGLERRGVHSGVGASTRRTG